MSIKGITFDNQKPTAAAHGRMLQDIYGDCRLYGCDITGTGSTITVASGDLCVAGRIVRLTAAENIAVPSDANGTVYVIGTVDLSQTSTTDSFAQFSLTASTSNTLVQNEVNWVAGSKYQVILASFTASSGSITARNFVIGNAADCMLVKPDAYGTALPETGLCENRLFFKLI